MKKKDKTIELVTSPCEQGSALARITDGDKSFVTQVTRIKEGAPLEEGMTVMTSEAIKGEPRKRRVISEYTHKGPSRASTPKYRKNYDAMKWN